MASKKSPKRAPAKKVTDAKKSSGVAQAQSSRAPARKVAGSKPAPAPRKPAKLRAKRPPGPKPSPTADALLKAEGVQDPKPRTGLTATQERFVHEYLIDRNGTQAYLRLFPKVKNNSARTEAWRLLTNPDVRRVLEDERVKTLRSLSIDRERLVGELVAIATADPNELIEYRRCHCPDCWPADAHPRPGIYDPPSPDCVTCGGEGVGREIIADTRFLSPHARALYAGVKVTRDGMQVLMRDQDGAIDRLARVLGVFERDNAQKTKPLAEALREFFAGLHGNRLPIARHEAAPVPAAGGNPLVQR